MAEHTKTPWQIRRDKNTDFLRITGPKQDNGLHQIVALFPLLQEKEIIKSNAEYIILAVNAHEGLVAFLKKVDSYLNDGILIWFGDNRTQEEMDTIIKDFSNDLDALAAAEKGVNIEN